jgi:hypothetical protein
MKDSVQPESDAKLSQMTGVRFAAFSRAAAILGPNDSVRPIRTAVAPQYFKKSLRFIPRNSNASRNCLLASSFLLISVLLRIWLKKTKLYSDLLERIEENSKTVLRLLPIVTFRKRLA